MGENVESGESEFGSVTSSQISILNNCPFADPTKSSRAVDDTVSISTEVLLTPISPPVTHTPILSPSSLDSINDEDVFRTPPENASLSSAAESEPKARVSAIKSTTRVSASASLLTVKNVKVLETNSDEPVRDLTPLTPPLSFAAGNVEVNRVSGPEEPVTEVRSLSSSQNLAAGDVRVPGKNSGFDSSSPGKQSELDDSSAQSVTEGIEVTESSGDDYGEIEIPFKGVIKALLRNNGENLEERDERVSYVDILKQLGLKFP
ncbi:unnamed protein product [Eruca vesicaria subsp. sativa]|uniref:Uncharacterized protein n=1 Tax=Eruca vesicaria subsp. sativa TaxID=29727 RepID=A0ABC8L1T3_ERUVS|nr:unnamed protein product [Eruca vesicaria subsp. sativa]